MNTLSKDYQFEALGDELDRLRAFKQCWENRVEERAKTIARRRVDEITAAELSALKKENKQLRRDFKELEQKYKALASVAQMKAELCAAEKKAREIRNKLKAAQVSK